MNAQSPRRDTESPGIAQDTPLLRTLLLTDLCDSTEIVERIGDAASAQLFRQHDKLVLELQQRWRGRLIDRSDGLLLLFERPIDGLGFALDYMRALKPLGDANKIDLRARAGLHVGEVLTWRNSVEAVQQGAKSLEVEGLAKPMAARLMTLARPGQILLSPVAEPLVHRASRELGERGDNLLWKSHGRWHFKGVPGTQEIHEVGEADTAPLRMPKNGAKAWRDIPLWRRPASLMAEAAVLAVIGFGAWFFLRSEPAIAFAERDWVVVGDMRNLTGDERLDESLEQAFRISLEQSRYVNVLSDLKARETLQRMKKPGNTTLDRSTASEIALRDGARAVILPTVSEVGGRLRVSAEVVDPNTQATVYAETADGRGIGSALGSVDDVTGALRIKLGEALASIQRDSKPLPQVTTSNIDALKAYALGQAAFDEGDYVKAKRLFDTAISLDPSFAMAYLGGLKSLNAQGRPAEGEPYLRKAVALSSRLPTRDRLHINAWATRLDNPAAELEAWQKFAEVYPDHFPALINVGYVLTEQNRFAESLEYAMRAQKMQNPGMAQALQLIGLNLLSLNRPKEAINAYQKAKNLGLPSSIIGLTRSYASMRNFGQAERGYRAADVQMDDSVTFEDVSIAIDKGDNTAALNRARAISQSKALGRSRKQAALFVHSVAATAAGEKQEARAALRDMLSLSFPSKGESVTTAEVSENCYVVLQAGIFFGLTGDVELAKAVKKSADPVCQENSDFFVPDLNKALASISGISQSPYSAVANAPYSAQLVSSRDKKKLGNDRLPRRNDNRGRVYGEPGCGWCQQPAYVYLQDRIGQQPAR